MKWRAGAALALLTLPLWCAAVSAAQKAATSSHATVGDLSSASVQVQTGAPVPGGASKAMENYRQFLTLQNTDPKLRAEALRRLGDLNLESGELERFASEVTQIDIQGAEAIRLYSTLLKAYPNYPRNDLVLYQLARAYETTGQPDQALSTLDSVVERYPNSRDIAEVQFRRGELLFSAKRYAEAQSAYEAVVMRGRGGSSFYGQSLYKHGWSLFKQSKNEESLQSFAGVLDLTLVDPKTPNRARDWDHLSRADRELAEDTLRVMCITFSYLDGAKTLDDFLAQRGVTPYAWLLYSRLGDLYVDKQRYQDAASAYRAFVSRDPIDEHAPSLSMQAIEAYRKGGFADLVLEGKLEYVQTYGFDAPYWQGREHSAYPEVIAELKTNLQDVAQHYHATAQKSKRAEDYSAAARWYRAYLKSFPSESDTAETNYLLADCLFESQQYADAASEYERTAYDYPMGKRSAEAGYAALVAYQKQEAALPADARAAVHSHAIDSGLRFAQTFPDHPESAGVLTRAAQDLYAGGEATRATQAAEALLARTPPVDVAKQRIAYTIIGQVEFNQAAYDKAEDAFTHALAVAAANDSERADLTDRLAAAVYKQGESKRAAGDESGAAEDFLRVQRVAPGTKTVATAQYDAAAALINAKQWDRAIDVLEAYRRDYPKSEYAADVTRKLAVADVEAHRPAAAAAEFERIAANPAEDRAIVHEALTKAADLYQQAGDEPHSVAMLERLVMQFPEPAPDAIEVRARLATIAAKDGNAERERYWQHEIIKADAAAGAARTDRTKYLASQAQLALAAPLRDAFRAIKLIAPLKQSLIAKKKAMEAAMQAYKEVAEYQVAETTTAATYESAELYNTLARDLLASERPKKLTPDEKDQYDALLEEQAFPFEEQAIAIHEINTARAHQGTYDDSVNKSYQALALLKPARYGKSEHSDEAAAAAATGAADAAVGDAVRAGIAARASGNLADAEASLKRATEANAGSALAWDELGLTLRQEGKFTDARSAYEHAIADDGNYALAHRNLGVLLDLYLDDAPAALPEFERYKALTGEEKPVTTWIAELRQRTGVKAPAAVPAEGSAATPAPSSAAAPTSTPDAAPTQPPAANGGAT